MVQFSVGIGQYEHRSENGGLTWSRHVRIVPARHSPVINGDIDFKQLPPRSEDTYWDFVTLLPCGFGVAVGHQAKGATNALADIFITKDKGQHWHKRDAKPWLSQLGRPSWPVERFASVAVSSPDFVAVAWEDPWLWDGSQSHVISSQDQGESWEYHSLGYTNPYLALDYGDRLLALNDGYYMESRNGGTTWEKCHFHVDWPDGYDKERVALLRQVTFIAAEVGYALVVHWPPSMARESPPNVGLLTTTDNGLRWRHLCVFEGPNIGDINERHVLDLRVTKENRT